MWSCVAVKDCHCITVRVTYAAVCLNVVCIAGKQLRWDREDLRFCKETSVTDVQEYEVITLC